MSSPAARTRHGRHRRHGRRGRAVVVLAVGTLVGALVSPGSPALAAHDLPPVVEDGVAPMESGAVIVARAAGLVAGQPEGWRMNLDVTLRNDGTDDVALEQVTVRYDGGSDPADLVYDVAAEDPATAPWVIPPVPDDVDDPTEPAEGILAGDSRRAIVPEDRISPFPLPDTVTVEFLFDGYADPVTVTRPLAEYVSPSPAGSFGFPLAAKDLADGEYVGTGQNHVFNSDHRRVATDRFAEDYRVQVWDGESWVSREGPADENESYFIWEKPVYAIADGTVDTCFRQIPDNPEAGTKLPEVLDGTYPNTGNGFLIEHAPGEFTQYSHLQLGSVPAVLCPVDGDQNGAGVQVKAGQLLGVVGNSGNSTGPHLHMEHKQPDGRPLLFHGIRVVDAAAYDPDEDEEAPWRSVEGASVSEGDVAGYGQVTNILIDPLERINLEVEKLDSHDPAVAGTELGYLVAVTNHGPDTATSVVLTDVLPDEVELVSVDGSCVLQQADVVCAVDDLVATQQLAPLELVVAVPPGLVHDNGGPLALSNTALASAAPGLREETPADNQAVEQTQVVARADLEVLAVDVTDPLPPQLLVGDQAPVGLRVALTNHGPSWPMDVSVEALSEAGGLAVAPAGSSATAAAVELDEVREVDAVYAVTCDQPGAQEVTFTVTVAPEHPADLDPDSSDNTAQVSVQVECVVPVAINIRPGGYPNPVQVGKGTISLAALTTDAGEYGLPVDVDASAIVASSLRFGEESLVWSDSGGSPEQHGVGHLEDAYELDEVTRDGDTDVALHVKAAGAGLSQTDDRACLKGELDDGQGGTVPFFGCDEITPVPHV